MTLAPKNVYEMLASIFAAPGYVNPVYNVSVTCALSCSEQERERERERERA